MEFDKTLLAGSTGLMLLKLLEHEDMYGYQMNETLRSRSEHAFDLKACTRLSRRAISPRGPNRPPRAVRAGIIT